MTVDYTSFYGRRAQRLFNDHLSLTVVPKFSGRVMELIADGVNYFWINAPLLRGEIGGDPTFGNWLNWGGYKTWLAPQSRWPDPMAQSAEMDNVEWEVTDRGDDFVELLGPIIPWGGVRLGRRLSLAPGSPTVQVRESIHNSDTEPRTWALWSVAQLPVPGWATYPPEGARRTLLPPAQNFEADRLRFCADAKWKVGAFARAGWGEYRADSWARAFRARFSVHMHRPYPDLCTLETWSNTDPDYMELEWLGPLVTLQPGERWDWDTEWTLT